MTHLFKYPQWEFFMSGCPIIISCRKKQNNMVCAFCAQSFAAQDQHKLLSEVFSWRIKKLSGTYQTHQKNRKYFFSITGKLSVFKITTQQMKLRAIHKDKKLKRDTYFELSYYNKIYCGFNTQFLCVNPHMT